MRHGVRVAGSCSRPHFLLRSVGMKCNWFVAVVLVISFCVVICSKPMDVCLISLLRSEGVCYTCRKFETLSLPSSYHKFNPSTRKYPVTSPKPSFSTLHGQTPTFPHSCYRFPDQHIEDPLHNPHRTREPATSSFPTERTPQYDRKPCGRSPTPLGQTVYVKDNSTPSRGECLLIQRLNGGFR